jgi:non-ribosomal peptide synthetase component F
MVCCFSTSGSSGEPKMAALTERNVYTFAEAARRRLGLTMDDVVLQVAPPGFDVVLEDILPALLGRDHDPPGCHDR